MLQISEPAMALCQATVQQLAGQQTDSKCLRILRRNQDYSISFEVPRADDQIVRHRGQSIIAVPLDLLDRLSGKTLDLADDGHLVIA